ncbi:SH3 domain-containing protein [Amycolatopsis sp. H20-H5]|uniref:SH3 domain-containing protein n=1 Tax=Amycolatopsis sp. H20-H5 TaxID=3046309 RepID=UPI003FA35181
MIVVVLAGIGLIYVLGTDKQKAGASSPSPTGCKLVVTADVLNAREAPASPKIVGKYLKDAQLDAQPGVQNGFRKVAEGKWVSAEFAQPTQGSNCG